MIQRQIMKRKKPLYLSVMGTMGSGKTTAARLLSTALKFNIIEENFGDNAFLPLFYRDMKRWAFHSQTFFLMEKIRQLQEIKDLLACPSKSRLAGRSGIIQDTPIQEDAFSYAKAQHTLGNMSDAEWNLYQKIYRSFEPQFPVPDLIIFLETGIEEIDARIKGRGRGYEQSIPISYLSLLDTLNHAWLKTTSIPILTVQTDGLNIVRSRAAQRAFVNAVTSYLKQHTYRD